MSGIFEQTPANRRRYGVAIFVGDFCWYYCGFNFCIRKMGC